MKRLHFVTALLELGAGVALMLCPSAAVKLLLGSPLDSAAAWTLGRVTGVALFALAVACWLAHYDAQSCAARGLAIAMVLYNVGVVVTLGAAGMRSETVGIALWPAVALHVGMTVWCVLSLRSGKPGGTR